jgi:hypothetical protein
MKDEGSRKEEKKIKKDRVRMEEREETKHT